MTTNAFFPNVIKVQAQTTVETLSSINIESENVQVNQLLQINMLIEPTPPTIPDVFQGLTISIILPDETTQIIGPFTSNSNGTTFTIYKPLQLGNYTFQLDFPGQFFTNNTYYNASTSPITNLNVLGSSTPVFLENEGSWTSKTLMPTARSGLGVAVVNDKIYAIGGSNASGFAPSIPGSFALSVENIVGVNEEYDPATDTWTSKTSIPTPRIVFATAVYQNKIYCIGGKTSDGSTAVNEVYDPATDSWEVKASMPLAQSRITANVVDNKIYVICPKGTNYVYDPELNTWETKEPVPSPSYLGYATAVFENKIYVIGGLAEDKTYTMNQIYDPETDTWNYAANIPTMVAASDAVATTGVFVPKRIYVIGSQNVATYNVENDAWAFCGELPTTRYTFDVCTINDMIYVIGGHTYNFPGNYAPTAANEMYLPFGYVPEFPSWVILPLVIAVASAILIYRKRLAA